MTKIRIGIVGLGWVAGAHIETFKKVVGAEVVAVCSRRKQDAKELEAKFGIPLKVYSSYAAMLADPVKPYTNEEYAATADGLVEFARVRPAFVLTQIP